MIDIIVLLGVLALIGVLAWALIEYLPMPKPIRGVIIIVAVVLCILIVLKAFGGVDVPTVRLGA